MKALFKDNGCTLRNPMSGWTLHYYSNSLHQYGARLAAEDVIEYFEGESCVYLRLPWSLLEPEEGRFDWSLLDTPAQRWIAARKRFALRLTTAETRFAYATPEWVFDAGARSYPFINQEGLQCFDPIYDDPVYLEKLELFLAEAGRRYNGHPALDFIDIGTFGTWGECHTGQTQKLPQAEVERLCRIHIALHEKYFPDTLKVINDDAIGWRTSGMSFPLMDECLRKGITLRDDSIAVEPEPNCYYHAGLAQRFWPTLPVILEFGHYNAPNCRGWSSECILRAVEEYHASYLSIHHWPDDFWQREAPLVRQVNRRLGYRIVPHKLELPDACIPGEELPFCLTLSNEGVAPCYPGGYIALSLINDNDGIAATSVYEGFNVRDLEVKLQNEARRLTVEGSCRFSAGIAALKPGKYRVLLSIGDRIGTPTLELPLGRQFGERRYPVGEIIVSRGL